MTTASFLHVLQCRAKSAAEIADVSVQQIHAIGDQLGAVWIGGTKFFDVAKVREYAAVRRAKAAR